MLTQQEQCFHIVIQEECPSFAQLFQHVSAPIGVNNICIRNAKFNNSSLLAHKYLGPNFRSCNQNYGLVKYKYLKYRFQI